VPRAPITRKPILGACLYMHVLHLCMRVGVLCEIIDKYACMYYVCACAY
jgi:hypothetical protein